VVEAVKGILKPLDTVGVKVRVLVEVEMLSPMPVALPVAKVKLVEDTPLMVVVAKGCRVVFKVLPLQESPVPAVILVEGVA
jgi:hypothetical protein